MSDDAQHQKFMRRAIELSAKTSLVDNAGGVFGSVIVKDGEIIAEGANRVVAENDPPGMVKSTQSVTHAKSLAALS